MTLDNVEAVVTEDAKEIRELKTDVWELFNLGRLLDMFYSKAGFWNGRGEGGNRVRNAATAALQKHEK